MPLRVADASFSATGTDQWNQIIYRKIAVVGDSLEMQPQQWADAWPTLLEKRLNSAGAGIGAGVMVKNFSTAGHSFFRSVNTTTTYGTLSQVQKVIEWEPDVVIVALGPNDALYTATGTGDNRTLLQIQGDATAFYTALRAGLPEALFIQADIRFFDEANFTTSSVVNKGIIPRLMLLKPSGILQDLYSSEMLDDAPAQSSKDFLTNYDTLVSAIFGIAGVSSLDVNLFRIERLCGALPDQQHLNEFGNVLFSSYVVKGLRAIPAFMTLVSAIGTQTTVSEAEDPDTFFDAVLDASGDGYTEAATLNANAESVDDHWGPGKHIRSANWFMPYKGSFKFDTLTPFNSPHVEGFLYYFVNGATPGVTVSLSLNGGSFSSLGDTTDQHGICVGKTAVGLLNLANGANTFRYRIGAAVFGPFTITLATSPFGDVQLANVGNVGTGEDDLQTFTIPAGFAFPVATRGIHVMQHGTFANNAATKTLRSYFGTGQVISGALTTNLAGNWHLEYWMYATGDDAQKYTAVLIVQTTAGTWLTVPSEGTMTQDDDAAIVVKCTGQATNNNDIIQTMQMVEYE